MKKILVTVVAVGFCCIFAGSYYKKSTPEKTRNEFDQLHLEMRIKELSDDEKIEISGSVKGFDSLNEEEKMYAVSLYESVDQKELEEIASKCDINKVGTKELSDAVSLLQSEEQKELEEIASKCDINKVRRMSEMFSEQKKGKKRER